MYRALRMSAPQLHIHIPRNSHPNSMDLLSILPSFSTKPYAHILPSLERSHINTLDLISLDTLEIAKRAHVPPADVRRLAAQITDALHRDVGFERDIGDVPGSDTGQLDSSFNAEAGVVPGPGNRVDLEMSRWNAISTLDSGMDGLLDGGIPPGYVTEVTGESGSGKTQFLLNLLLAVQLPPPKGLTRKAIYISTEASLATPRLSQYLQHHPYLSTLPRTQTPSLQNILAINAMDLEAQEHILNYQLPVAISRYNVGLVVIDSITANFRAERTSHDVNALSTRSGELAKLGQMLRNLAAGEDVAVVVANQVSDQFDSDVQHHHHIVPPRIPTTVTGKNTPDAGTGSPIPKPRPPAAETNNLELLQPPPPAASQNIPSSSPMIPSSPYPAEEDPQFDGSYLVGNPVRNETLSLLHQQRFFTGWGDALYTGQTGALKIPALGFVWTTQIAGRIALRKEAAFIYGEDVGRVGVRGGLEVQNQEQSEFQGESQGDGNGEEAPSSALAEPDSSKGSTKHHTAEHETTINPSSNPKPTKPPPAAIPTAEPPEPPLKRTMKLVFAPWAAGSVDTAKSDDDNDNFNTTKTRTGTDTGTGIRDEVEFEIWKGGLRSVGS